MKSKLSFCVHLVLIVGLAFSLRSSAFGDGVGQMHSTAKISPDLQLAVTQLSPGDNSLVDIIVQFNKPLEARHYAMLNSMNGEVHDKLQIVKAAALHLPLRWVGWLAQVDEVTYISLNHPVARSLDLSAAAVGADAVFSQYKFDGTAVGVAVIDSGISNHPDLMAANSTASRVVYSESFVPNTLNGVDAYGHGTHVAGIIASNGSSSGSGYRGTFRGIAPNANLINLRVLDQNGSGSESNVIAAIQRAIALKDTYNIRVINLSLGRPIYESYKLDPLCQAVEQAWKAGIVVVVAAGNSGRDNSHGTDGYATIAAPGNDPYVITVGATRTMGTPTKYDDLVATYSSKGPTMLDHIVKPDLVAPGNRTISLIDQGSTLDVTYPRFEVQPANRGSASYFRLSGTSMATPVVSGAVALLLKKNPQLTPDQIKARLMKTAWKGFPSNSSGSDTDTGFSYFSQYDVFTVGAGMLDVEAAINNNDVAVGLAVSPSAVRDPLTGTISIVNGSSLVWGNSVVWGSSLVWGNSVVWGNTLLTGTSICWGNSVVWGSTAMAGYSVVWGNSLVWGTSDTAAFSVGSDGEN